MVVSILTDTLSNLIGIMLFLTGTIKNESEDFRKLNLRDRFSILSTLATYYIRWRRQTVEL